MKDTTIVNNNRNPTILPIVLAKFIRKNAPFDVNKNNIPIPKNSSTYLNVGLNFISFMFFYFVKYK